MTLQSMTGTGRAQGPVGPDRVAEISVRSVNHRSLDLTIRLREPDASIEPLLRRVFSERLSRGKVDVSVQVRRLSAGAQQIVVDEPLLEAILARFAMLAGKYPLEGRLQARDLLAIPQLFSIENGAAGYTLDELGDLEKLASEAARSLTAMREAEGDRVGRDLASRLAMLNDRLRQLAARRDEIAGKLRANLQERLRLLLSEIEVDSGRLEQEAALAADRSDISEELHRLEGHLSQFGQLVETASGPIGKKLEFLSQEILRELNTLGSKARDLSLIRDVIDMKSEIEKIREQVQNLE